MEDSGTKLSIPINDDKKEQVDTLDLESILLDALLKKDVELMHKAILYPDALTVVNDLFIDASHASYEFKHLLALRVILLSKTYSDNEYINHMKDRLVYIIKECCECNFTEESNDELSEQICKMFWPVETSPDHFYTIMITTHYFLVPENLARVQSFINLETITGNQFMSGVYEMNIIFMFILEKMYELYGFNNKIQFPDDEVQWNFDNPKNPIEKTLRKYLQDHPEIKTEKKNDCEILGNITFDKMREFMYSTYNMNDIITTIHNFYCMADVADIIEKLIEHDDEKVSRERFLLIMVCDFIMNCDLGEYVY